MKYISVLSFVIIVIFSLAACSEKITNEDNGSGDTTPPEVVATYPPAGEEVLVGDSIVITFSEPLDCASVDDTCIDIGPNRTGTVTCDSNTIVYDPDLLFDFAILVHVTVKAGIKDTAGNAMPADYVFEFYTEVEPGK